jgi:hypothetical protein
MPRKNTLVTSAVSVPDLAKDAGALRGTATFGNWVLKAAMVRSEEAGTMGPIVHGPLLSDPSVVELHCMDEVVVGPDRLKFTLFEPPPYEAVTEPLWLVLKLPVLIANEPATALVATVTDAGTVRPARPVLLKLTTAPPGPAACDSVTVQLPLAFGPNVTLDGAVPPEKATSTQ